MSSRWGKAHGFVGYDDFRINLTIRDAWAMLMDESEDRGDWMYKRRRTRLRLMHKMKLELYREVTAGRTEEEVEELAAEWRRDRLVRQRRRYAERRAEGWRRKRVAPRKAGVVRPAPTGGEPRL